MRGYRPGAPFFETPTDKGMRGYDKELGKDALDENEAHTVANIMVAVLDELKNRSGIDSAFDQIDDEVLAEMEQTICEKIEPHTLAYSNDVFDEGYEHGRWSNE